MSYLRRTLSFVLLLVVLCSVAYAQGLSGQVKGHRRLAIDNLLAAVDIYATEAPRISKNLDGTLRFFGAPRGAPAAIDSTLAAALPEDKALGFMDDHRTAFGLENTDMDFQVKRIRTVDSRTYIRLGQTYADLPVFAAETIVQLSAANSVYAVFSDVMTSSRTAELDQISLVPSISAGAAEIEALDIVAEELDLMARDAQGTLIRSADELQRGIDDLTIDERPELMVYDPEVVGNRGVPTLAWRITVGSLNNPLIHRAVFVDAYSGKVVLYYSLINDALEREVYDADNSTGTGDLEREEGDPPSGIDDVDDAYDFLGDAYDFYYDEHGRDSVDDDGLILEATVRSCRPLIFFCPPFARWDVSRRMYIGEGWAVDDVIGHELTHGVTNEESQLVYVNQSGAISESLSDVWGEFIDLDNSAGNDDAEVRWLIGEDLPDGEEDLPYGATRNMEDPTWSVIEEPDPHPAPDPDRMNSDYYYDNPCTEEDSALACALSKDFGGVHTNSGVNNKLCYLLTDGDTFNGHTVEAMGVSDVADLYYECQTNLLSMASDYVDLYHAMTQAAVNLEFSDADRDNIEEACQAVEIIDNGFFVIRDNNGRVLARFDSAGDLLLTNGELSESATISPNENAPEFIIKKGASDYLVMIDAASGNMYIEGNLYEEATGSWTIPDNSFIIRRADEVPVAVVNSESFYNASLGGTVPAGSLILDGVLITSDLPR